VAIGSPFRALELGPGDSVASAIVARAFGATETYLVDVGRFAAIPVEDYLPLVDALVAQGYAVPDLRGAASIDELCERVGARYLVDGVASLRTIPSASIDVEWSQAVLEHVRVDDFDEIQSELRRVLRPSGVASHRVDLQDHLAESLNNLRFSDRVWERPAVWKSGFYTNRMRCAEIIDSMTRAGFATDLVGVDRWPSLPVKRTKLASRFRDLPTDELRIRWFDVLARPSA
jgi:SAM-dependent methyltransferase